MPKGIKLIRAIREGGKSFVRAGWLSASAILTTALALFVIGLASVQALAARSLLSSLEEKMDITISFESETSEDRILAIKKELERYKEVRSISYTSREAALEKFRAWSEEAKMKDVIEQALEVVDENPLNASLSIKARTPEDYRVINSAIETSSFQDDIFRVNYRENETAINRLTAINREAIRQGAILGSVFLVIALLVTFNTIRLTMHARREDFEVMRLVGASNLSVRTPAVVEGILYGGIASLVSILFLFIYISFQRVNPFLRGVLEDSGLLGVFTSNFLIIFLILSGIGIFVGAVSGFLAVRRYLKI